MPNESKTEGVVDRIEGDTAVIELEWRQMIDIPLKYLPEGTHEGAVLDIIFRLNPEKEKDKRDYIKNLQQKLLRRSKK
jgi:hypothetical protein